MGCIDLVRCVLVLRCGLAVVVWYPYVGAAKLASLSKFFFLYVEVGRNVGCELALTSFRKVRILLNRAWRCRLQKQPRMLRCFV